MEQLRFASEREEVLHEFQRPTSLPWTMTELAAPINKGEYEDITMEKPQQDDLTIHGEAPRWRPPQRRVRRKTNGIKEDTEHIDDAEHFDEEEGAASTTVAANVPTVDYDMGSSSSTTRLPGAATTSLATSRASPASTTTSSPTSRTSPATTTTTRSSQSGEQGQREAGRLSDRSRSPPRPEQEGHLSYWADETAAMEIEINMPKSRHGWKVASRDLETYFLHAMKKKDVEVHERHMDAETKAQFRAAKGIEVKKFLSAQALEALPPSKQPSKEEAMRMRWVLTWKTDHAGETSAKARAVVLGFQDPLYEHRVTYAPTTTLHTRQLMLQLAACRQWHAWKGDVAAAFLQGRECPYDLYCIPTEELCEAMGIPKESVARLRKACYGLVQAPYAWYETVRTFLLGLGFFQCGADPCCWVLHVEDETRAVISGHVDDFMMVGSPEDVYWLEAKRKIQEHFRWGEFEYDDFTQCGVQIRRLEDGSYTLSQVHVERERDPSQCYPT